MNYCKTVRQKYAEFLKLENTLFFIVCSKENKSINLDRNLSGW